MRGNGRDGNRPGRPGEADVENARVDAGYRGWASTCTIPGDENPRDVGNCVVGSGDAAGRGCLMDYRES